MAPPIPASIHSESITGQFSALAAITARSVFCGISETFDTTVSVTVYDQANNTATVQFTVFLDETTPIFSIWTHDADLDSQSDNYAPNTLYEDDPNCQGDFSGATDSGAGILEYRIKYSGGSFV